MLFVRAEKGYVFLETEDDDDILYILYKYDMRHISKPEEINRGFSIRVIDKKKYDIWKTYRPCIMNDMVISQQGARVPDDWCPSRMALRYFDKFNIEFEKCETTASECSLRDLTPSWVETDTEGETERIVLERLEESDSESEEEPEATNIFHSFGKVGFYT